VPNFVRDLTALDFPKSDLNPLGGGDDPNKHLEAANWNTTCQALIDVRGWIRTGLIAGTYTISTLTVDADGRITGVASVTASAVIDQISAVQGSLLTRGAGGWAAMTTVFTSNGDITFADVAAPVVPSATSVKVFGMSVGGRRMLGALNGSGATKFAAQPFLGHEHAAQWIASLNNAITTVGMINPTTVGTATGRALASTNIFTASRRLGLVSAAGAGSTASIRCATAFLLRQQGFMFVMRFGLSDAGSTTTGRTFAGVSATTAALGDADPSGLVNLIGIGTDANDTVLQLYAAGAAAQARVSLGANFPANTINTDAYEIALNCGPGGDVTYLVTRINTGQTASGTLTGVQLPAATTFLTPQLLRSNGVTAIAVGVDLFQMYAGTDL